MKDKTDIDTKCVCGCGDLLRGHVLAESIRVMDYGTTYVTRLWDSDELTVKWGRDPLHGQVDGQHCEMVTVQERKRMLQDGLENCIDLASGAV